MLSDSPFADDGTLSSTRIAILDPDGEGIRAFTFVGISIGGEIKGGSLLSFCVAGRGMLYMNCRLEFVSMSLTDLVAACTHEWA